MNKQELIERIEDFPCEASLVTEMIRINKNTLLGWVKELDGPQKVTVPQFVADWIEKERKSDGDLEDLFCDIVYDSDHVEWFREEENMNFVARAWLDGFEIEKEKRYYVKLKAVDQYLVRSEDENFLGFLQSRLKSKFTRKQLEQAELGWVFDCPGVEIEEVE